MLLITNRNFLNFLFYVDNYFVYYYYKRFKCKCMYKFVRLGSVNNTENCNFHCTIVLEMNKYFYHNISYLPNYFAIEMIAIFIYSYL